MSELVFWLAEMGFSLSDTEGPDEEAFGNWYAIWTRRDCTIQVVRDRGEWEISAAVPPTGRHSLAAWEAYLKDEPMTDELASLDEQAGFLRSSFDDMLTHGSREGTEQLIATGELERARRLFPELFARPPDGSG